MIHHLQCVRPCSQEIWPAEGVGVGVDERMRAREPWPRCAACGELARPNVLMFGDVLWVEGRTREQEAGYAEWCDELASWPTWSWRELVVIEIGAGEAIPTVRWQAEMMRGGMGGGW